MEKILDDLMAVTQIKQHKTNAAILDPKTLVHMTIKNLKNIEKLKQTELVADINENIRYNTDEELLKIIVSQLIENAVSFNNTTKQHKVLISMNATNQTINISVTDNGIGISTNDMDYIFDLYYRGKTVDRGIGIGLYLVKAAIEKLGGNIAVNSKVGMGTEVQISIPNQTNVERYCA
jgi:signal transduction histidine kinase